MKSKPKIKKGISMKMIISLALIISSFLFSKEDCMAQSIELSGTYFTSDVNFYKNTPGISFAYTYHFKRQFVFVELNTSRKDNNSFTDFDHNVFDEYIINSANGSFSTSSANVGVAQKIVTSSCFEFSVGADAGLNYYKQNNEYISFNLDQERNEILYFNSRNEVEKRKNKFGYGAFIDMELKGILLKNLSIFSRLNIYHSGYIDKPVIRDDVKKTFNINSTGYRIGLRYRIQSPEE